MHDTVVDAATLRAKLTAYGWTPPVGTAGLENTICEYQQFHGLRVDGWAGPITQRHLDMPRFCACPDRMTASAATAKWPHLDVSYWVQDALPGWTLDKTWEIAAEAFAGWAAVTALTPKRSERRNSANIIITVGPIDGMGKVLAWSNLPPTNPCFQKYDSRERGWVISATPGASIDALAVFRHEMGHALGLDHDPRPGQLMSAIYQPGLRTPQANDVARMGGPSGLYPRTGPVDPPPPPPPGERVVKLDRLVVTVDGKAFACNGPMAPV